MTWSRRSSSSPGADAAVSFLFSTAARMAATARRNARFRHLLGLDHARFVADWRTPERIAEQHEASRIVYSVLDQMSEKRRTVFILAEMQGLRGEELARVLGCPASTAATRLHHARREFMARMVSLRARLQGAEQESVP
jgi:RNA polymerase sigma factor (sigma-70 family)